MSKSEIKNTIYELLSPGKGLLAADESFKTIKKRLEAVGVESTQESRCAYREMLFGTPGIENYISGVILYDETIRQQDSSGRFLRDVLTGKGIIPGIKVDTGTADMPMLAGEKLTGGLDGLRDRLVEYRDLGARFTKWRAAISIGDGIPTHACIDANAQMLAEYAALVQDVGLVPIVEPEVLMDGGHDIARCEEVTRMVLRSVFAHLLDRRVALDSILLKPNMILPGKDCSRQVSDGEVADRTITLFKEVVPAAVPGIVFLSGGQDAVLATQRLNTIAQTSGLPWKVTFSFARALQGPALDIWRGNASNVAEAQRVFLKRAMCNGAASRGQYSGEMEQIAA
ncbi:fructose-bisphosphate aldolase class I [bacterium]|nr:fructose-bisphosphate aldolase class I [bacterium]